MDFKSLNDWQRNRLLISFLGFVLVGCGLLFYFGNTLYNEKVHSDDSWVTYLSDPPEQAKLAEELSKDATKVYTGTYVENLSEINLKSSYYRVTFLVWFNWEGDPDLDIANHFRVYKGVINSKNILKEVHEGDKHYQLVSCDVTVSKNYETKRFPLESQQMRFYIEAQLPIQEVLLVADRENSGMNKSLTITGYDFLRHDIGAVTYKYDSTHGDPDLNEFEMASEIVTSFEINRSNFGMYFKCFFALIGTITWVLISLYICTYHRVDPLGMIPGALFGTVGNIMVGASLLPDSLEMGLLEYVNLCGIVIILLVTLAIININRIRNKYEDRDFAQFYGRVLFYTVLVFTLCSNIMLPLLAYRTQ